MTHPTWETHGVKKILSRSIAPLWWPDQWRCLIGIGKAVSFIFVIGDNRLLVFPCLSFIGIKCLPTIMGL